MCLEGSLACRLSKGFGSKRYDLNKKTAYVEAAFLFLLRLFLTSDIRS